jgi:Flp pilus assembly protein TadG
MVGLLAVVGFGLDLGRGFEARAHARSCSDAAALDGALALGQGQAIGPAILTALQRNSCPTTNYTASVAGSTLTVGERVDEAPTFSRIFGIKVLAARAQSKATAYSVTVCRNGAGDIGPPQFCTLHKQDYTFVTVWRSRLSS